jgi:Type VI secretion system (T6SS), amidase effector protein 4
MLTPKFGAVWDGFPTHSQYQTMGDLYRHLGGGAEMAIKWTGFGESGNTCASRVSVALNRSNNAIDPSIANALEITTLKCADGSHIIFRVKELRKYMLFAYGRPDIDTSPPFLDQYQGKKGIIAFTVSGWTDATGHFAMYDGNSFKESDHDDVEIAYPEVTIVQTEMWILR